MYGWHMQSWGAGGWLVMAMMMLLFWSVVVIGVIALVRYLNPKGQAPTHKPEDDFRRILDQRLARGEIDEAQYKSVLEVLDKDRR